MVSNKKIFIQLFAFALGVISMIAGFKTGRDRYDIKSSIWFAASVIIGCIPPKENLNP